jgi:hypothetical protein
MESVALLDPPLREPGELWLAKGTRPRRASSPINVWRSPHALTTEVSSEAGGSGEIALPCRQWDEAEEALRQAWRSLRIGNPTQLWKTHLALGQLQAEANRREQAEQSFRAACAVIDQIRPICRTPGSARVLNSPIIQRVS